jgi:hypothetical protein
MYGDFEHYLALPFEEHIAERLCRLISQTEPEQTAERDRIDLARRIVDLITAMLEGEVLPPTEKQLKYAVAIAQELSLELPAEVLRYRTAMTVFLGTYAPQYRRRRDISRANASSDHGQ